MVVKKIFQKIRGVFSKFRQNEAFTLVEVLVSVAIFSMSIVIVTQTFVYAVRLQKQFLATTESLNEISYLMEYMTRSIRMAKKDVNGSCLSAAKLNYETTRSGNGIKFKASNDVCREFYLENQTLKEIKNADPPLELTSPKVRVLSFNIGPGDSWDQDDYEQPKVTVYLELKSTTDNSRIQIQTTISQRNPDIKK